MAADVPADGDVIVGAFTALVFIDIDVIVMLLCH